MSAKRRPGNDLNHDNWDEEQEQEDVGEFRKAPDEVLQKRTFKVAKRRLRTDDDAADGASGAPASVFSGFGGFGAAAKTTAASSPFSFLSSAAAATGGSLGAPAFKASSSSNSNTAGGGGGGSSSSSTSSSNSSNGNNSSSTNASNATTATAAAPATEPAGGGAVYFAKLKGLNQSVSAWIAKHIADNPVCLLTPIFDDYAKHLKEIEEARNKTPADNSTTQPPAAPFKTPDFTFKSAASTTTTAPKPAFSFGSTAAAKPSINDPFAAAPKVTSSSTNSSPFSFGLSSAKTTEKPAAAAPTSTFSFGSASSTTATATAAATSPKFAFGTTTTAAAASTTGFSFGGGPSGSSQPFSFASIKPPTAAESAAADDDDDAEPPKNEFTPVVEEDSLFKQRCKVFVKSGGEYSDRGVGQLYIKSVAGGSKSQLLVRADTNLGRITLNVLLTEAVPASRMGKNNVMMICVPTPDDEPPAVTVLVRVKNETEADELLAQINKHKK